MLGRDRFERHENAEHEIENDGPSVYSASAIFTPRQMVHRLSG